MGGTLHTGRFGKRWVQLGAGSVAMVAVANFQYAWTLFALPLEQERGWDRVQVQDALAIYFTLAQTWLAPCEGYLAERFGPGRLMVVGGALAAIAWIISANATSLAVLNAAQVLSGCGAGIVYSISVGNALKWFPDRRGLAAGLTAAAFGAGSAVVILPIHWTIQHAGYAAAFFWFGLAQGGIVILAGLIVRFPPVQALPEPTARPALQPRRDYSPRQTLRQPVFWLLYAMMTMAALPGLLMNGQLAPMARDFGVADVPLYGLGLYLGTVLQAALVLDRLSGGVTRPAFGWLSDRIGREAALFLAFTLEGTALLILIQAPGEPLVFVAMSGLAFFGWGAVFSLFPAASADLFGPKFAVTNYGLLYTAKGAASLLVALCNRLQADTGSWSLVFALMIAADWLAALLALFVLRPLRLRLQRFTERGALALTPPAQVAN